jgi:hypothetical protein
MKRLLVTLLLSSLLALGVLDRAANEVRACPNCKEAVSRDLGETSNVADGYNWSVVFMLAVPFSLLGTGALMVRRAVRQGSLPEF